MVKDRLCDNKAEDDQELLNEVQQEIDLVSSPEQEMEIIGYKRTNSCPSILWCSDSGEEEGIKSIYTK